MNAYISNDLNMVKALDPDRHALALKMEAFLNKGGTIEVLQGPSFVPPPVRHEPPPTKKAKPVRRVPPQVRGPDKYARREMEREEREALRKQEQAAHLEYIRDLASKLTYAQAVLRTGIPLRELRRLSQKGDFTFQPVHAKAKFNGRVVDEEYDARQAAMIRECKAMGFSRNKARESIQASYKAFDRLLEKFNIDYPKVNKGPHPAFFAKQQ